MCYGIANPTKMSVNSVKNVNKKREMESELPIDSVSNSSRNSFQHINKKSNLMHVNQSSLLKPRDITKYPTLEKIDSTISYGSVHSGKKIMETIRKEQKIYLKSIVYNPKKSLKPKIMLHTSGQSLIENCSMPGTSTTSKSMLKVNNAKSILKNVVVLPNLVAGQSRKFDHQGKTNTSLSMNNITTVLSNDESALLNPILDSQNDSLLRPNKSTLLQIEEHEIVTNKLSSKDNNDHCSILKISAIPNNINHSNINLLPTTNDLSYLNAQPNLSTELSKMEESKITEIHIKNPENNINKVTNHMPSVHLYGHSNKKNNINKTKMEYTNQDVQSIKYPDPSPKKSRPYELDDDKIEDYRNSTKIKSINSNFIDDVHDQMMSMPNLKILEETKIGSVSNNSGLSKNMLRRLYGYHDSNSTNIFETALYGNQPFHMLFSKPANTELWCMRKSNNPMLAGYNPLRGDFAIEYDNTAEELPIIAGQLVDFSRDERRKDVRKLIKEVAVTMVQAYNNRLSERHRRKEVIKRYGLINQRGVKTCISRHEMSVGKSVLKRSIKACQILTPDENELLMASLAIANELKSYLNKILFYRSQHGVRTMLDMNIFENERNHEEASKTRFNVRNVAMPEAEKKRIVTQIFHLPRYKDLSPKEADLCSSMRLTPELFLKAKDNLLAECKRSNGLLLKTARRLVKIDVNKTRKIFDLLMENGSIWPPGENI